MLGLHGGGVDLDPSRPVQCHGGFVRRYEHEQVEIGICAVMEVNLSGVGVDIGDGVLAEEFDVVGVEQGDEFWSGEGSR